MKKNIYIMYVIGLMQGMVFYGPVATLYRQSQGVSLLEITIIESVCLSLCIFLEIPWGIVADKIGYKKTMIFCSLMYLVSKIVFWFATDFYGFLMERVILGVVIAGLSGVDTSILFLSCAKGQSQRVFGVYNSLQMVGLLAAAMIFAVFIGDNYSLAGGLTVISYALAAFFSFFLVDIKPHRAREFSLVEFKFLVKSTFKNVNILLLLISIAFLSEAHQSVTVFLSQAKYAVIGLSPWQTGYVFILVSYVDKFIPPLDFVV